MESLQFSQKEMAAIIALAKAMAHADGSIDKREVAMMSTEALRFGITPNDFMNLLRKSDVMEIEDAFAIISVMNDAQKSYVTAYLGTMMAVDGNIDDAEMKLWNFVSFICKLPTMNIVDAIAYMQGLEEDEGDDFLQELLQGDKLPTMNIVDAIAYMKGLEKDEGDDFLQELLQGDNNPSEGSYVFHSNTHQRYENNCPVRGEQSCKRDIKIEKNISGLEGYSVTIYNLDGVHPLWQDNVQMATKPMKVVSKSYGKIELKGYGYDKFAYETLGAPMSDTTFENYGLTIYHDGEAITHCVLHMIERDVDIDYYVK